MKKVLIATAALTLVCGSACPRQRPNRSTGQHDQAGHDQRSMDKGSMNKGTTGMNNGV
jgi:hypothetical protein